jgi:flagellar M-ring protein FliF
MNGFRDLLTNMTPRGRIGLAASVLAVVLTGVVLFSWASRPSYTLALTGLDPAETGKITTTLDERGIGYQLRNNGTAVAVEEAKTAEAQIALAEGGQAGSGSRHPGFELVTEQKLGASNFQQQVAFQQALEGQLGTVIEQIQGVSRADVQLALPDDQLFAEEGEPPTASVLLGGEAGALSAASIRGIAGLVASSVKGLKTENVTITDAAGTPLWPTGEATGAGGTSALQAEAKYARSLESQVDAMLARTLGPGKAKVQVAADLDMTEGTREELRHGRRGIATTRKTETETFQGTGGAAQGGAAGTAGNVPNYAAGAAGAGESEYERESAEEDLGVDKTVTRTKLVAGEVQRMSVALVVDKSVPTDQVDALRDTVAAAVGLDTERGDTIRATQLEFAKPPAEPAPSQMKSMMGLARYVAIGIGALVFLVLTALLIRRAERRPLQGEPVWLRELDGPRTIADLERGVAAGEETEAWRAPDGEVTKTRKRLEQVVEDDTERVAATVRAWMQED